MTKKKIQEKIDRWQELKDQEARAKKERTEIEDSFVGNKNLLSGKDIKKGLTQQLEVGYKKSSPKVDQEMAKAFVETYEKTPFKTNYSLDANLFKAMLELEPKTAKVFGKAVTVKPARPEFNVKDIEKEEKK